MVDSAYIKGYTVVGVGWPWTAHGPEQKVDLDLMNVKIGLVLFTFIKSHKMEPTFGSTLLALVFETRGRPLQVMADIEIRGTLAKWLPEVQVRSTKVTDDPKIEGLVTIDVAYEYLGQEGFWQGQGIIPQTPTP